jgi:hypothetical protein
MLLKKTIVLTLAALAVSVIAGCEKPPPPPPPDTDKDGILDDADKCKDKPETKNGFEDTDGCPDEAPPPPVVIPAYEPTGDMADLKKAAAAGIDDKNGAAKAAELDAQLEAAIKDLEAKAAEAAAKKGKKK